MQANNELTSSNKSKKKKSISRFEMTDHRGSKSKAAECSLISDHEDAVSICPNYFNWTYKKKKSHSDFTRLFESCPQK